MLPTSAPSGKFSRWEKPHVSPLQPSVHLNLSKVNPLLFRQCTEDAPTSSSWFLVGRPSDALLKT
jgi:hypothetical protein